MGRISLQKNNKNAGKRAVGLGNILAGLVAITIVGTGLAMSGCGFQRKAEAAATDMPVVAQTASPTATPTLKPTSTPIPTLIPTTSAEYEEEKQKLGIYEENMIIPANYIYTVLFETESGEKKVAFALVGKGSQNNVVSELFTMENIYTIDASTYKKVFEEGYTESVKPINDSLSKCKFLRLSTPKNMNYDFYPNITGKWMDELYKFFEKNFYVFYKKSELAEIYLKYVPKEYRVYGSDFTPGKKAEFPIITPSPSPTATIAPTAFRDGNASVRYLTGNIDLDTEIENKTKRM